MAEGRFLSGSTMGHVVRMTATGALGITFVFLVDAANLFWISQLGQPRLMAAIGFAYAIQFLSVSSGVGLMIACTALVSRSIGEGRRDTARGQAGAAILTAVLFQAGVAAVVVVFRHELLALAGARGETAALAARYLLMTIPSLVLMAVGLICSGVLRAEGMGAKAMYITLVSGALLMVIDPILILWLGLGLDGAAIGLVLFRAGLMMLGLYFAVWQQRLVALPDIAVLRASVPAYLAIGMPAIATQMATPAGNYLLTMVIAPFGDDAVAGWAVVGRLTVVAFGGIFALSGAIGGIFGQNFGAGENGRVVSTYRDSVVFCVLYALLLWAVLWISSPLVVQLFGLGDRGAEVVRAFTGWGAGGFVFAGALFVANAAFNSLGRPGRAAALTWIKEVALAWPVAMWFSGALGAVGVIYGQALASVVLGGIGCLWGWRYVRSLRDVPPSALDLPPPRPYPNPDRFRRR
jgi:Na+-driven multidrug efflux pump